MNNQTSTKLAIIATIQENKEEQKDLLSIKQEMRQHQRFLQLLTWKKKRSFRSSQK